MVTIIVYTVTSSGLSMMGIIIFFVSLFFLKQREEEIIMKEL
jgi:hypothetical protein